MNQFIDCIKLAGLVLLNLLSGFAVSAATIIFSWLLLLIAQCLGMGDAWFFQIINTLSGIGSAVMFIVYTVLAFATFVKNERKKHPSKKRINAKTDNNNIIKKEVKKNE